MKLDVKPIAWDETLGIVKKSISISKSNLITPTKSIRCANISDYKKGCKVNEIAKRISPETIENFHGKDGFSQDFKAKTAKSFDPDCLNIVLFNLIGHQLPDKDLTETLAHVLYSSSDKIICLPAIQKAPIQSPTASGKSMKIDEDKVKRYLEFQEGIINGIRLMNSKPILGIIPLLVPKYTKQIINFYFEKEIFNFIIDANTGNILNKEPDLRSILSSIDDNAKEQKSSLADTYIHAVNLGLKHFSADEVSSDDFLSLFAYVDTIGTKFKTRGAFNVKTEPRKKVFLRNRYAYKLLGNVPETNPLSKLKQETITKINNYNEQQQFTETTKLKDMIGKERMDDYLKTKGGISQETYGKLESISSKIKIT